VSRNAAATCSTITCVTTPPQPASEPTPTPPPWQPPPVPHQAPPPAQPASAPPAPAPGAPASGAPAYGAPGYGAPAYGAPYQPHPAYPPAGAPGYGPPPQYPTGGYQVVGAPPPGAVPPGVLPPGHLAARPVPTSPGGQPLAEFSDRLVATIIDALIIGAIYAVVAIPAYIFLVFAILPSTTVVNGVNTGPSEGEVAGILAAFFGIFALVFLFMLLLSYLYEVEFMLRGNGQTVGKRVMKIRVVPIDPAQSMTRAMYFKRYLVHRVAASLIPAFSWVDGLWQLWDQPFRQCLHDKYAKTVVIKIVA
jgi:uncharacterized RDD family membrane protein YckC